MIPKLDENWDVNTEQTNHDYHFSCYCATLIFMVLPEILHMELSSIFLHSTPNESEIKLPADVNVVMKWERNVYPSYITVSNDVKVAVTLWAPTVSQLQIHYAAETLYDLLNHLVKKL